MKRALLVFALAVLALSCACAQTVIRETAVVVAWDAPTETTDGQPVLPDDAITYRIYIENVLTGARVQVAESAVLEQAVVIPYRAVWRIGVSALLDGTESDVAWSTVAADCEAGETFVLRPKGTATKPKGLEAP